MAKQRRVFATEKEANLFAQVSGGYYYKTYDGFGKLVYIVVYEKETL